MFGSCCAQLGCIRVENEIETWLVSICHTLRLLSEELLVGKNICSNGVIVLNRIMVPREFCLFSSPGYTKKPCFVGLCNLRFPAQTATRGMDVSKSDTQWRSVKWVKVDSRFLTSLTGII